MKKLFILFILITFVLLYFFLPSEIIIPAEFSSSEGVLLTPRPSTYYKEYFAKLIKHIINAGATPYIIIESENEKINVINLILSLEGIDPSSVEFLDIEYDEFWTRDYAPLFYFKNGRREILDNQYYCDLRDKKIKRPNDNAIPVEIGSLWNEKVVTTDIYTEAGNFMTDGKGTCFMTKGIFDKNPDKTESEITTMFKTKLGCKTIYYVDPIPGEGTRHIDMFAKIVNEDTILVAEPHPSSDLTKERKDYFNGIYHYCPVKK